MDTHALLDARTLVLIGAVLLLLGAATGVCHYLKRRTELGIEPAILETFWDRVLAWWMLLACLAGAFLIGHVATVFLFLVMSFWALREFISLTPTRLADHRTLFWVFFLWTPLQFLLVGLNSAWLERHIGIGNYALFAVMIPVYAGLFVPVRVAVSGDATRFLERTAKIQMGLFICVYCLSYAPALLTLDIAPAVDEVAVRAGDDADGTQPADRKEASGESAETQKEDAQAAPIDAENGKTDTPEEVETVVEGDPETIVSIESKEAAAAPRLTNAHRVRLLFFFVLIVQLSDAFQYAWSWLPSRHYIAEAINATRTWEGVCGGALTTAFVGGLLYWATPFSHWWQAVLIAGVVSVFAFGGTLVMSAIKRDRGVSDYGTLVEGHRGVLDRLDSLCFAAPVFYHLTCWFVR